jgi:hypothetical protein
MIDHQTRVAVIRELRTQYGAEFDPGQFASANVDAYAILNTCLRLGAVFTLIEVLELVGGPSAELRVFTELARKALSQGR